MASKVPPTPATEEAIVDCVAFFYEQGKGDRIRNSSSNNILVLLSLCLYPSQITNKIDLSVEFDSLYPSNHQNGILKSALLHASTTLQKQTVQSSR